MSAVAHLPRRHACATCGTACLHCAVATLTNPPAVELVATPDLPDYLTVADVAARLSVSDDTVSRLVDRGELKSVRIGRSVRIPAKAYLAYTEALT